MRGRRPDNFRLKKWSGRNLKKPSKGKCQVLCLGRSNPLQEKRQELAGFRAALQGRTWGSLVENWLAMDEQRVLAATAWAMLA